MRALSKLWLPLLLVSPLVALHSRDAEWTERLFYPLLDAPRIGFYVGLEDLRGVTFDRPGKRVGYLRERIDDGEHDLDTRLQLVRALLGDEEREEAFELLERLGRELIEVLSEDPEDWELVAQLGEVSRVKGTRFRDREALKAALRLLNVARANDEELWQAPLSLAQLFLWQSGQLRQAGERAAANEALARARRMAEEAMEIGDDEFTPHALFFLIELTEASFEYRGDAQGGLERMVEIADMLEDAADYSDEPEVALAIGDMYTLLFMLGVCQDHWNTVEAFDDLASGDGDGSVRARAVDEIIERTSALEGHYRLWSSVSLVRWWLARHADLSEADELFDEAMDAARDSDVLLESAIGLETRAGDWDAAEAIGELLLEQREDERTLYFCARLAGMRGELESSIEGFEEALDLEPDMLAASIGLAISLLKEGDDIERATELLEAVLIEDDELFTAHFALASALLLNDDPDAAVEHLEIAVDLAEEDRIVDFLDAAEAALEELEED